MVDLFAGSLGIGMVGLVGMAGMHFAHGLGDHGGAHGLHVGDAVHGGHIGDIGHIGDAGHAGHIGHIGDAGHAGHIGDVGHGFDAGHAGHAVHAGHAGHAVDSGHAGHGVDASHGHGDAGHGGHAQGDTLVKPPVWLIPSPITIFSWMIGFGLAGIVLDQWLPFQMAAGLAVANAIVFERFAVRPYWEWIFKSASTPGTNLEGAVATRAIAITSFNARGQGLVRLTVDGQDRDVLARLMPGTPPGFVRKGDALFIERVDEDNSVMVSKPDSAAKA